MWLICILMLLSGVKQKTPLVQQDEPEEDAQTQLIKVRRIFVDSLTGGDTAMMIRDLLMSSLQSSKLFIITEEEDRADAILKGAGEDNIFTDRFSSSEGINAHASATTPDLQPSNARSSRGVASLSVGENESRRSDERKHEAIATVRLVNKDGDVIWSTTQESLGGKFMGAAADVANKVSKRLIADYKIAQKQASLK